VGCLVTDTYVVVKTQTVMDGAVVRWYRNYENANNSRACLISASRNGVMAAGYITPDLFEAAWRIHLRLQATRGRANVADVVTHERAFLPDELVAVPR